MNSTLNGNDSATGGVLVNAGSDPQDAFRSPGTGSLRNVTFADNSAGVENLQQTTTDNSTGIEHLRQSTTDNSAGVDNLRQTRTETIVNTILDNIGPNCIRDAGGGAIISTGGNLDSGRTCAFAAAGDRSGVNPRLAGLGYYGGQTLTRALQSGSPARDHGIDQACPSHDQRGVHRPQGPHCDIGAFEAARSSTP